MTDDYLRIFAETWIANHDVVSDMLSDETRAHHEATVALAKRFLELLPPADDDSALAEAIRTVRQWTDMSRQSEKEHGAFGAFGVLLTATEIVLNAASEWANEHPADDGETATKDWLEANGFRFVKKWNAHAKEVSEQVDVGMGTRGNVFVVYGNQSGGHFTHFPRTGCTRGDVRRLVAILTTLGARPVDATKPAG